MERYLLSFVVFTSLKEKITPTVRVDMCDNHIVAVSTILGNGIPIVDRFHVAKICRKSIVKLQLDRLMEELAKKSYQALHPASKIPISKQEHYNKKEKLLPLFKLSPAIKSSYCSERWLTIIHNVYHKKETVQRKIEHLVNKVGSSSLNCLEVYVKNMLNCLGYISSYFIQPETTSFVESINNKVRVIKRPCYGIYKIGCCLRGRLPLARAVVVMFGLVRLNSNDLYGYCGF